MNGASQGGTYDYVIVGAGAAGCVLANRLSRDPSKRVLLLEAGPKDHNPLIHMPRGIGKILGDPRLVWPFPVHTAEGANSPPAIWVRGKTLGGSSSVNGMMYVRGQPADFDALAQQTSKDWGWDNIGRIYGQFEGHSLGAAATRGSDGPLKISMPKPHRLMDCFLESGASAGLRNYEDTNQPDNKTKLGYCPQTIWRGKRQSAATAFLRTVRNRPNLTIATGVTIERVVFEGSKAVGVQAHTGGESQVYHGRRTILSGGTFASPVILQRSGVGDPGHLSSLSIPMVAERSEVGRNLREHCALAMQWRLRRGPTLNREFSGLRLALNGIRYYLTRSGPLASASYDVLGSFKSRPGLERPDAQLIAAPYTIDKSQAKLAMEREPGMQVAVYPLRPQSTGSLQITSRDPDILPKASLDYFKHPEDRRVMVDAVRVTRRVMAEDPIAQYVEKETRPGPEAQSDADILQAYREMGGPAYHAAGTCRMGSDPESVVDPMCRVRGTDALHVVDLSIAPFILAGNTFAPVTALAWRAAELIERLEADES